jgi:LuxR family maltose regulon positive regulatory protein
MGDEHGRVPGVPAAAGAQQLLRAKLRLPAPPAHFVCRPRLVELLDQALTTPLTLVVAPAGAGKSVLCAGWLEATDVVGSWFALDDADRDPAQLLTGLLAALEGLAPGTGEPAKTLLRRRRPPAEVVARLVDDLGDVEPEEPRVLVIDDVHLVDDRPEAADTLGALLQHLPPWLHVVAVSRRDPDLPLERLRARGHLVEVRVAELRFSKAESAELLSRLAPWLPAAKVEETVVGVDGWAAGLQLAALAARSDQARTDGPTSRGGSDLLVDDFVWREVLAAEAVELVELLLDIAVVERVNGSLAEALSLRPDAGELLVVAERRGLFVTRLGVAGWVEVHALVRSALVAELGRRSPERARERHRRAAAWYEREGEVTAALEHWLLADRPREALRLLAQQHLALYDEGREAVISRVVDAIPSAVSTSDFAAMLDHAWCHLLVSRRGFVAAVDHAAWWASQTDPGPEDRARLQTLQAIAQLMHADWAGAAALARRSLEQVGGAWMVDSIVRVGWNVVGRDIALSERWDDLGDEVRQVEHALDADPDRRLALEGTRGLGLAMAGRPIDALEAVAGIRHAATVTNMSILRTEMALAEAIAHRELGDHGRAMEELDALVDRPEDSLLYLHVLAQVERVEAHLDVGALAEASCALDRAEATVAGQSVGRGGRDRLARAGVALAVATLDLDRARGWAETITDPFWRGVCTGGVHAAAEELEEARGAIDGLAPRCPRHEVVLALLQSRVADHPQAATKWAGLAVEAAAANQLLQTMASAGPEAVALAEREAWRAPAAWSDRLRRVAAATGAPAVLEARLVEPLTERERDVLRYLPSRLTTREIADELYVSVNTLKFHLKVIYRKLGVTSRADAVERARQGGR